MGFTWVVPNLLHPLLPWLMILGLLLLKPNRCAAAWWIVAPLAAVLIMAAILSAAEVLPVVGDDMFFEAIGALAFGLAAVWLLAPVLARSHRFLTFLCLVPTFAAFSALAVGLRHDWTADDSMMAVGGISLVAFGVGGMSLALFLAGWVCRRSYQPVRLLLWFLGLLAGVWIVIITPFFAIAMVASGGGVQWLEFSTGLLATTAVTFGLALPFLLLSFANAFFCERLRRLLHLGQAAPPKLPAPPAPSPAV